MTVPANVTPIKIAIFASGTGSNAMALLNKAQSFANIEISFVLSDKATAGVLPKAKSLGIRTYLIEKTADKATHEKEILKVLQEHRVDWILLAGYMRLISPQFLQAFARWHQGAMQIVNIHPSLLPAYPGVDSIARAYQDKVSHTGISLHFVDEGMDTGALIRQEKLAITPDETLESLSTRMHELEHLIYTEFLASLALQERKTVYFEENV